MIVNKKKTNSNKELYMNKKTMKIIYNLINI